MSDVLGIVQEYAGKFGIVENSVLQLAVSGFVSFPGLAFWNVMRCSNCQTHLEVKTAFGLQRFDRGAEPLLENLEVLVRKRTQDEPTLFKSELSDAPRTPKIEIR